MGASTARLALIEFADFQCPYCQQFAQSTLPRLEASYIKKGTLLFGFRHFPVAQSHPQALMASAAAACAGQQGDFWEMFDWLYRNQASIDKQHVLAEAGLIRMNVQVFDGCTESEGPRTIQSDAAQADLVGVEATPTFIIGRIQEGGQVHVAYRIEGASQTSDVRGCYLDWLLSGHKIRLRA